MKRNKGYKKLSKINVYKPHESYAWDCCLCSCDGGWDYKNNIEISTSTRISRGLVIFDANPQICPAIVE